QDEPDANLAGADRARRRRWLNGLRLRRRLRFAELVEAGAGAGGEGDSGGGDPERGQQAATAARPQSLPRTSSRHGGSPTSMRSSPSDSCRFCRAKVKAVKKRGNLPRG